MDKEILDDREDLLKYELNKWLRWWVEKRDFGYHKDIPFEEIEHQISELKKYLNKLKGAES